MPTLQRSILHNAIGLALFALFTAGAIALVHHLTASRIEQQARRAQAGALLAIVPRRLHDNDILASTLRLPAIEALGLDKPADAYIARLKGHPTAIILPVIAPDGYSGAIRLLVGIERDGKILGVRVIENHETPGLGDRIELKKSNWVLSFDGKSLDNPGPSDWKVRKDGGDFDQFTGATITPRAVVGAVYGALRYFRQHRDALLTGNMQQLPSQ
ncbi:electron transport complex subunit RsxG [Mangrovitalea sediminis]|uniref:electron transport complex subunit RsxG n=1 Tax=Mangrovitalea sediminis TaxID=1982043 RepID=UPI000BE56516|nr:electron transport complex subunit RsxG [Mangrovitalea sediminis]